MRWWWRIRKRPPSEETEQARADTQQARERLEAVHRDDERLRGLTARTERQAARNNFGSDIKRALGGSR